MLECCTSFSTSDLFFFSFFFLCFSSNVPVRPPTIRTKCNTVSTNRHFIKTGLGFLDLNFLFISTFRKSEHNVLQGASVQLIFYFRSFQSSNININYNKKVLLRERKRHTARRVAIASPCYSGWRRGPLDKNFFSHSEHVSSQIWCQKIFPVLGRGPSTKIFFVVSTCIKPNLLSKIFPFTRGGGSLVKKSFSQSEHVSSQIWW